MFQKVFNLMSRSVLISVLALILLAAPSVYAQQAENYDEAVTKADALYRKSKFYDAKAYYQIALRYAPDDKHATEQIKAIVNRLKEQQVLEEEYYEYIDLADVYYEEASWDRALAEYRKALRVIPSDEYARDRVDEVQRKKAEEKDKILSFNMAMKEGNQFLSDNKFDEAVADFQEAHKLFPDRPEPTEKIELAKRLMGESAEKMVVFEEEIDQAERYILVKDYISARQHYENAQLLFPKNTNAKKKLKEIKPLAEKQAEYNAVVEEADNMYVAKDFAAAKKKYEEAEQSWPENDYSSDMIEKIDDVMAEQLKHLDENYQRAIRSGDSLLVLEQRDEAKSEYNLALNLKPDEEYPKSKIREIDAWYALQKKEFEANYNTMIAEADQLYDQKDFIGAKEKYNFALEIKPDDEYPKQKLKDIEIQLALIEEEQKKDAVYNNLVAEADELYNQGHYDLAINKYAEAQTVKSAEKYPQQRIEELSVLLVDAEKQRELDEKYDQLIVVATRLFNEDKLGESKKTYQNALELKPGDLVALQGIRSIDSITDARIRKAEIEKQYIAYLATGDSLLGKLEFDAAITAYSDAIAINPDDPRADEKRSKAQAMKVEHEKALARKTAYENAIAEGERLFDEKNYELAKEQFVTATGLMPEEAYPVDKIKEIDEILKRLEAEKEERFNLAIVKADNLFEQQNFSEAVVQYKIANSIKPGEPYPSQRIMECNTLIEEQLMKLRKQYDIAIADADKLYAAKIYDKAINAYKEAKKIKPDETYPTEMIDKITSYIIENAIVDVVDEVITIEANTEQRFEFEPVRVTARKSNYVVVKARNLSEKEFKIIFGYGSSNGKNGGFVVQVPNEDGYNDFIIRVGNQYKWFSEDNNWFTIYPENGSIEIKMVRISSSN